MALWPWFFHKEIGVLLLWKQKGRLWTGSMCHCMRHPYVTYCIYLAWEIFIFIGCGNHGNVVFLIGYYLYALRHRIPDFNTSGEEWSLVREMSVLCRAFKAGINFGYYRDALGTWTHSSHIPHNIVQIPKSVQMQKILFLCLGWKLGRDFSNARRLKNGAQFVVINIFFAEVFHE